jgi:sporulation protein YlmC with PRC-barrel domain
MSETFRAAVGRKAVSRVSAEDLGPVRHFVVDVAHKRVGAVVVGKGRKARIVDWADLSGFGPDAVMVVDDGALRVPVDDHEKAAVDGKLDLLGKRALSDLGNELGKVDDVVFDPATGQLERLVVGDQEHPAAALLGFGSYAAVLADTASTASN